MAANTLDRETLLAWWEHGVKHQCSHLLLLDEGHRPYFSGSEEQTKEIIRSMEGQIWAVYNLHGPKAQLDVDRAWNV